MQTADLSHMTTKEFKDAITAAPRGARVVYATGDLVYTRDLATKRRMPAAKELNDIADLAYYYHVNGLVYLTQKRLDINVFEYRALKR